MNRMVPRSGSRPRSQRAAPGKSTLVAVGVEAGESVVQLPVVGVVPDPASSMARPRRATAFSGGGAGAPGLGSRCSRRKRCRRGARTGFPVVSVPGPRVVMVSYASSRRNHSWRFEVGEGGEVPMAATSVRRPPRPRPRWSGRACCWSRARGACIRFRARTRWRALLEAAGSPAPVRTTHERG